MKKRQILPLLLAMTALCGTTSMASETTLTPTNTSGSTAVSYIVKENTDYTVTIPPSVTISENKTGQLPLTLTVSETFNAENKLIYVKLTESENYTDGNFYLKSGSSNQVEYLISKSDTASVALNDTILSWNSEDTEKTVSETLQLSLTDSGTLAAGTYTDTLTFTVALDDATSGSGGVTIDPGWDDDNTIEF